ncbi:MAG: DoxX family protein [Flavobacteriaceae bacterium]|nr:DoxX family protein [Flavobacteriaceae bacterium]
MNNFLVQIARIFVGGLFIFSGFIKLNDPLGFSYKLEEYFGADVLNLEFLIPLALPMAVFIVIYELLLGVTLLIGFLPKFTKWSLLLMIVFFTFLTFYSAYFNKVTDCGCFGDAIPLTPWESFYKDVILLILIVYLFMNEKLIRPLFNIKIQRLVFAISLTACGVFAYFVLNHLPLLDFRPYKIGVNIQEGMEIPDDAEQATYEYKWKFLVNGKEEIISTSGSYPETTGEFLEVETILISEGYEAPITDFGFNKDGQDFTDELLAEEKLLLIATYNLSKSDEQGWKNTAEQIKKAQKQNYRVVALSASSGEEFKQLFETYNVEFEYFFADETAIKTIVRSNPGLLIIKNAVIEQKYHWNDATHLKF